VINEFPLTIEIVSRQDISQTVVEILRLMELEHAHAHTHAQRNAYQAVVRHELEVLHDRVLYARSDNANEGKYRIPF